jgi:hypothetical protein
MAIGVTPRTSRQVLLLGTPAPLDTKAPLLQDLQGPLWPTHATYARLVFTVKASFMPKLLALQDTSVPQAPSTLHSTLAQQQREAMLVQLRCLATTAQTLTAAMLAPLENSAQWELELHVPAHQALPVTTSKWTDTVTYAPQANTSVLVVPVKPALQTTTVLQESSILSSALQEPREETPQAVVWIAYTIVPLVQPVNSALVTARTDPKLITIKKLARDTIPPQAQNSGNSSHAHQVSTTITLSQRLGRWPHVSNVKLVKLVVLELELDLVHQIHSRASPVTTARRNQVKEHCTRDSILAQAVRTRLLIL